MMAIISIFGAVIFLVILRMLTNNNKYHIRKLSSKKNRKLSDPYDLSDMFTDLYYDNDTHNRGGKN